MSLQSEARVLILTPTGRDAEMVTARLQAAGLDCQVCSNLEAVLANLPGAGAVVIAQEALNEEGAEALVAALEAQEPWSDIPVILLTFALTKRIPHAPRVIALFERANVMLLQRPLRAPLFLSAVRSAVRARRRQYEMRDLHRELARAVHLGDMFVSILGHDLRTPLGAIKLSAEMIVRASDDARALRPAGRILASADRMTRMIEQLLDFARIRQGRGIRLQPVRTDLADISRQVLQELGDANPQARIELSVVGDVTGIWDPDRLAQVVSNLAGNAVQHGTPGSPITVALDGTEGSSVQLRVTNQGAIPAETIPTLFEPFKRRERSDVAEKGLGLGLFIAQGIAGAHGGKITARTTDTETQLEVTLPREAPPMEKAVLTPA